MGRARSPHSCPQKPLVRRNESQAGYRISLFEAKIIFQLRADVNMETIPGSYAGKFPVFKKAFKLLLLFGTISG